MTNIGLKTSHQWSIPSAAELDKALQALRAKHPEFVFLTLITKLRTSRWKEAVLAITQLRYTNLKSAVLIQFQSNAKRLM